MHVLGFDIGGTKCAVVLCRIESQGIIWLSRQQIPTGRDWAAVLDKLICLGQEMLAEFDVSPAECRAGISCGGPLDLQRTRICSPPNLPGWDEVPVVSYLAERLMMPVRMQNDADACALAEWQYGAGRGTQHMVFLTFGTGLGAGLILNGRLYTGAGGMAGEAGHLRMEPEGPVGYGKAGSLEGFCSGGGIARMAKQHGLAAATAKDVIEAARSGEPAATELLQLSARYFGRGLSVLIDLLNPELIVAGGIYMRAHELMAGQVRQEIVREALPVSAKQCKIVPAELGEKIGDYGAVMAALYE